MRIEFDSTSEQIIRANIDDICDRAMSMAEGYLSEENPRNFWEAMESTRQYKFDSVYLFYMASIVFWNEVKKRFAPTSTTAEVCEYMDKNVKGTEKYFYDIARFLNKYDPRKKEWIKEND